MSALVAFTLLGVEVDCDTECSADGQVVDGTMDVFVGGHSVMTMGTSHFSPPISMHVDLDNFGRKCYLVDDESFEAGECPLCPFIIDVRER